VPSEVVRARAAAVSSGSVIEGMQKVVKGTPRMALVGIGQMGRNHLRVLSESPLVQLVVVVDNAIEEPDRAILRGAKFARTIEAIDPGEIDCVVIATPTQTHHALVRHFLERGVDVLVEKPIAATLAHAVELKQLAEERGLRLMVGHLERLNPAVRKLKQAIDHGWLGDVIHFDVTRVGGYPTQVKGGNNVLLDLAVHDIDVLNYLYGPFEHHASICHSIAAPGVYDTAEILLAAPDGPSAAIHVNWITPTKIRTLRVTGTKGVCFVDYVLQTCELMGGDLVKRQHSGDSQYPEFIRGYVNADRLVFGVMTREPLLIQLENLVRELRGGLSEICSVDDAIHAVRIAHAAVAAQIEGLAKP